MSEEQIQKRVDSILEAERARVRDSLEGMKKKLGCYGTCVVSCNKCGYNQALIDCLQLLQPNKEPNGQEEL